MSLATILDSIVGVLVAEMPELKTVELAGGRVDLAEMQRRSAQLPGAFVCLTATRKGHWQQGKFYTRAFFLVVLAATSRREGQPVPQDRAHGIARLLTRGLTTIAAAGDWGDAEVYSAPEEVASMNPYSAPADKANLALWGITWEQDIAVVGDPDAAELPPLTSIHTDYLMTESAAPVKDAEDDIDTDGP